MAAVELTRVEEFAVLTINRPEALNALNSEVVRGLNAAFDAVRDSDARALLITGTGDKAFCAGADIKEFNTDFFPWRTMTNYGQATMEKLAELPITSIALLNGYALGGGMELALACTFRLMAKSARVGLPEIKLGLIPGYGGTQRLPRLVGESRALEITMSGRMVGAEEAERIGLVNKVLDGDLMEEGKAFARTFTCYSLPTLYLLRTAMARAYDTPIHEGLKAEADVSSVARMTEDAAEGTAAFVEKRKAVFKDR